MFSHCLRLQVKAFSRYCGRRLPSVPATTVRSRIATGIGTRSAHTTSRFAAFNDGQTVIIGIMVANGVVFLAWQKAIGQRPQDLNVDMCAFLESHFTTSIKNLENGRYWTLLTGAFSHISLGHFFSNMVTMYAFGSVLVLHPGLNGARILAISLGSALTGSVGILVQQMMRDPRKRTDALGASGVVMGLGCAAALLAPTQRMLLLAVVPVPLWGLMAGYFMYDAVFLNRQDGVAHSGHLGGLAFGAAYYWLSLRRFGGIGFRRF